MKAYGCYLMIKKNEKYEKLVDIVDMPDLGGEDDELEITTLSDGAHRFMPGIKGNSSQDFTINHDYEKFKEIKEMECEEKDLAVWLGFSGEFGSEVPDGSEGKWSFKGYISIWKNSQSVGDVPQDTLRVTPSSVMTFE